MGHLPPDVAAQALQAWPLDEQGAIAYRIATLRPLAPDVVQALDGPLTQLLEAVADQETPAGVGQVAAILNEGDSALEQAVLSRLDVTDPPLADAIRSRLFPFEQVAQLDDRALQQVLRQVDNATLAKALKGAPAVVHDKIFRNLSAKAQAILRDDLEVLGPVRRKDVEQAQKAIVRIIRDLDATGTIVIRRGAGDAVVD